MTFFLTEALFRIASDLTRPKDMRIFCVEALYEIQAQSNPFVWITVKKDLKFHIINLILKVSLLPQKNKEKLQIVDRALAALDQIKVTMKL